MRGGKAEVAEDRFAKALEVLGPTGDAGLRSDAKRGLGQAQQARGDFGASRDSLQAAVALAQQAGDARREAMALSLLGATQIAMREPAEAERRAPGGAGPRSERTSEWRPAERYGSAGCCDAPPRCG